MEKKIITVSREFGSGGRTVGKMLSEKLGVPYYDKDIVNNVAEKTGFDKAFIEENGEFSNFKSFFSFAMAQGMNVTQNGMSVSDMLFCVQRQVILDLAQSPCVIVGRCADYILKDRGDCFNTFIYADMASRAERIVRLYGESEKKPEQRLNEKDKKRRIYCKHYTDREWGDPHNYDLCLNSGVLGLEKCAELIISAAKSCG